MGRDGGYSQGPVGVPPLGSATDHGYDGETRSKRRVGVPLGSGGNVSHGDPTTLGVHQEASGEHNRKGGLSLHL